MKRIISVLLSMIMLLGVIAAIPAGAVEVSAVGYNQAVAEAGRAAVAAKNLPNIADVTADTLGDTKEFQVNSFAGLENLSAIVQAGKALAGVTIYQTADIVQTTETEFKGIGWKNPFSGSFDGQGYTIGGLKFVDNNSHNVGLFPYVRTSTGTSEESGVTVVIKNIVVKNSSITTAKNKAGFIVGSPSDPSASIPSTGALIIDNCFVDATCSTTYTGDIAGGIMGQATQRTYITNCTNNAIMSAAKRCGGILGRAAYVKGMTVVANCVFGGTLTSAATATNGASPLVGQVSNLSYIGNCKTTGSIVTADGGKFGRVIGYVNKAEGSGTVVYNNVDNVNTTLDVVGGVVDEEVSIIETPSAMKFVGVQQSAAAEGKTNLRFVAAVNDASFDKLVYHTVVMGAKTKIDYEAQETEKVYSSILAKYGTEVIDKTSTIVTENNVKDATCEGLSALVIKGVPTTGTYFVTVDVCGIKGEAAVWGDTVTVVVSDGVIVAN